MTFDAAAGRWQRAGRIAARGLPEWAHSHVALPVLDSTAGGDPLLYFSTRDRQGRSRVGRGRLVAGSGDWRLDVETAPVLDLGSLGAFDDAGVTPSCLVSVGEERYLYYTGWTLGVTVPFYFYVGLAVSIDGGATFRRASRAPILERSDTDPYLTASPWVLIEAGVWRMWYVSGVEWTLVAGKPRHRYHIRYAESRDGVAWARAGQVCVDFAAPDEYAFGRPCVARTSDGRYHMWYSCRGDRYRIGYAESTDGLVWQRRDPVGGLDPAPGGWDAEMVEYPLVFPDAGRWCMLYNGNDYGRTGLGVARWVPLTATGT